MDFLGLAGLLAAIDLELPIEIVGLNVLLAILIIFTESFSSSTSSTLTLFLNWSSLTKFLYDLEDSLKYLRIDQSHYYLPIKHVQCHHLN